MASINSVYLFAKTVLSGVKVGDRTPFSAVHSSATSRKTASF